MKSRKQKTSLQIVIIFLVLVICISRNITTFKHTKIHFLQVRPKPMSPSWACDCASSCSYVYNLSSTSLYFCLISRRFIFIVGVSRPFLAEKGSYAIWTACTFSDGPSELSCHARSNCLMTPKFTSGILISVSTSVPRPLTSAYYRSLSSASVTTATMKL